MTKSQSRLTLALSRKIYLLADFTEEVAAHKQLDGFEVATPRSYPVRLASLAVELHRRTYHMVGSKRKSAQVYCEYSLKELLDILGNIFDFGRKE